MVLSTIIQKVLRIFKCMHIFAYNYVFLTLTGYHTITINLHFAEYLTSIPVMALMKAQFKLLID